MAYVRVNISMDDKLHEKAKELNIKVSKVCQDAILAKIETFEGFYNWKSKNKVILKTIDNFKNTYLKNKVAAETPKLNLKTLKVKIYGKSPLIMDNINGRNK